MTTTTRMLSSGGEELSPQPLFSRRVRPLLASGLAQGHLARGHRDGFKRVLERIGAFHELFAAHLDLEIKDEPLYWKGLVKMVKKFWVVFE